MIHVITGPPCAGKSTHVRETAKQGDLIVDFDVIGAALGELRTTEGHIFKAAQEARSAVIDYALEHASECEAWIIDTKPRPEMKERYEAADADFINLECSREECERRARESNRPPETLAAIAAFFMPEKGDNKMLYKSFKAEMGDNGSISGYFSTYNDVPDSYGDVVKPGAFTKSIERRRESGHPFPMCWNHDLDKIIGAIQADAIKDDEHGPWFEAPFLDTPLAQEKRAIVKSGCVYQFSFAYDVLDEAEIELADGTKANELRELELYEISIVPIPANQNALMSEVKAGRRNSASDESAIKEAINLLQQVLGEMEQDEPDEPEEQAKANEQSEEPEPVNGEEKARLLEEIKSIEKERK